MEKQLLPDRVNIQKTILPFTRFLTRLNGTREVTVRESRRINQSSIDTGVLTNRPYKQKNQDDPLLKKLSSRLHGDGGDLVPGAPLKSGAKGAPVEAGLILGLDEKTPDTWWYYDGEGSLITVAPPGSGKTQSQVFPNLLG